MTAYELRRHLAEAHDLPLRGLPMEQLVMLHDHEHLADHDHTHKEER